MQELITLHFSPRHAQNLCRRGVCQLDIAHLTGQRGHPLEIEVRKTVGSRLRRAAKHGRSARVRMEEIDGAGKFADFFKNLGQKISEGYQKIKPYVAPLVKEAATKLADVGTAAVSPYLPSSVNTLIQQNKGAAVDALGNVTGAYGMHYNCPHCGGGAMIPSRHAATFPQAVRRPQPWSNWSTQAMPLSPAMTSKVAYPGWGLPADFGDYGANLTGGEGFRVI